MESTRECFYCGDTFFPSDSVAKNTPPEFSNTYCCLRHKDLDTEAMKEEIAKELNEITFDTENFSDVEVKNVGEFSIKIKK
jgi:hypothetical protein